MMGTRKGLRAIRYQARETWMRVKDPANLRRRRVNKGFSQADLAHLVRRSQATISLIERGQMKTMTEDLALLISARLGVDWEDYFIAEEASPMIEAASSESTTVGAAA